MRKDITALRHRPGSHELGPWVCSIHTGIPDKEEPQALGSPP